MNGVSDPRGNTYKQDAAVVSTVSENFDPDVPIEVEVFVLPVLKMV
jgi:hypothetical protein